MVCCLGTVHLHIVNQTYAQAVRGQGYTVQHGRKLSSMAAVVLTDSSAHARHRLAGQPPFRLIARSTPQRTSCIAADSDWHGPGDSGLLPRLAADHRRRRQPHAGLTWPPLEKLGGLAVSMPAPAWSAPTRLSHGITSGACRPHSMGHGSRWVQLRPYGIHAACCPAAVRWSRLGCPQPRTRRLHPHRPSRPPASHDTPAWATRG